MLTGGLAAAVWICLPIAAALFALRRGWPAVPTASLVCVIVLLVFGFSSIWNAATTDAPVILAQPSEGTYSVAAAGHYQIGLGLIYAVLVAVTFGIVRLDARLAQRCMEAAFGLFHLGASAGLFYPVWARTFLPKQYVSYEEAFARINLIMWISSVITLSALLLIALCLMGALGRAYLRRKE
jgi:hypothetical protein